MLVLGTATRARRRARDALSGRLRAGRRAHRPGRGAEEAQPGQQRRRAARPRTAAHVAARCGERRDADAHESRGDRGRDAGRGRAARRRSHSPHSRRPSTCSRSRWDRTIRSASATTSPPGRIARSARGSLRGSTPTSRARSRSCTPRSTKLEKRWIEPLARMQAQVMAAVVPDIDARKAANELKVEPALTPRLGKVLNGHRRWPSSKPRWRPSARRTSCPVRGARC